eukprot:scaffold4.g4727.t1
MEVKFPALWEIEGRFVLSLNQEYLPPEQEERLKQGDEVAIVPPISGGMPAKRAEDEGISACKSTGQPAGNVRAKWLARGRAYSMPRPPSRLLGRGGAAHVPRRGSPPAAGATPRPAALHREALRQIDALQEALGAELAHNRKLHEELEGLKQQLPSAKRHRMAVLLSQPMAPCSPFAPPHSCAPATPAANADLLAASLSDAQAGSAQGGGAAAAAAPALPPALLPVGADMECDLDSRLLSLMMFAAGGFCSTSSCSTDPITFAASTRAAGVVGAGAPAAGGAAAAMQCPPPRHAGAGALRAGAFCVSFAGSAITAPARGISLFQLPWCVV